jgi:YegS/Rv2252/BmrU family lipid kinase
LRGGAALERIERSLAEAGFGVERIAATDPAGTVAALSAALSRAETQDTRVVVAGGDGTIHAALPALIDRGVPLVILPVGSVNVLARDLGIPTALDTAIRVAERGQERQIDLGYANGRPFALMAGIGFDAEVVRSVAPDLKNLIGSLAYVARGLQVLASYPQTRFHIEANGEEVEAAGWLAVVANASRYTYHWRLAPDARIDDGWLDLCFFASESALQTAGQVVAVLGGQHSSHLGVRHLRAKRFRFHCEPDVAVQLDGDPAGSTPVEVTVAPGALTVMVPSE